MKKSRTGMRLTTVVVCVTAAAIALAGCTDSVSDVDRAKAQVSAKEKALADAQTAFSDASDKFCSSSKDYVVALDRYGDVLTSTAPTVGDVRVAGKDLAQPKEEAYAGADAAVKAQKDVTDAEKELAKARTALAEAEASGSPVAPAATPTSPAPLAPAASVDRVKQAESEFSVAQSAVTDATPLKQASVQFNSAVVALEMAWLKLYADAGCISDANQQKAAEAVSAYTTALQQDLATAGYYPGPVDGVYGPITVQAVQDLQKAAGLPVTGTVDKATADALQAALAAKSGAAAQASVASTAAVQQTLKLLGFWDGPVDGVWTPELTDAVKTFQITLGVEPTGAVDAATIAAFEKAIAELTATPAPSASPSATP
ncbi:peptidoglycan-binding protein [Microbacterium rhizosphaerae]|uniref:Peptidoglycan-binding protein n=1 Tax=Microbacterium rhizosphaerae TaxID=1678237 RepID=A0ABZ0SKJ5_9MICO|nr:peptidoglycan-binding protein [Microbacterium rhizosphaerae]WPR89633.1 peptidoglycan-binding protein [Microbacterium rhizosphaerae]